MCYNRNLSWGWNGFDDSMLGLFCILSCGHKTQTIFRRQNNCHTCWLFGTRCLRSRRPQGSAFVLLRLVGR